MIILHVLLAVASLIVSSINFFSPSTKKTTVSYGLATSTLVSGVLLILVNNASVLRTCLTGIVFFGVVTALNQVASRKLATQI
jgi:hypothetical protein